MTARILPTPDEVRAASKRIAQAISKTPFYRSDTLSEYLGGDVWLKMESEQLTGSFKLRGATNAMATLSDAERARGVVASSAGNHGLGIATAAKALGVHATVFVPRTAPSVKRDRIAALGATVDSTAAKYDDAEALAREYAKKTGATFVGPCTGVELLAGQGTIALEVYEALPTMKTIIAAVGGAGLIGGIAGFLRGVAPHVRIIGAQSERTNAMTLAMASGQPTDVPDVPTIVDALSGQADAEMLAQAKAAVDEMVASSEEDVLNAIAYLFIEEGFTVEGGGACPVAALLSGRIANLEFPVVAVISGGNIDPEQHKMVLADRLKGG